VRKCYSVSALLAGIWSTGALAQVVTVPNTFSAGTAISASQVNTNFASLATAINNGIPGYESVTSQTFTVPANTTQMAQFTANCPTGKVVLGGGFYLGGAGSVVQSQPTVGGGLWGWLVGVNNPINVALPLTVFALCAFGSQPMG
jgi:hypothetical protein